MTFTSGISQTLDPLRLRLLVEVERRGSIAAAAESCGISQPSASKHLRTVELTLGEKLVERDGRASRLTDAGHVVALHASRALATLSALDDELTAMREGRRGTVTIAASTTPGAYVLPMVLKCFAEEHPGIDVDVAVGPSAWVFGAVSRREAQIGFAGEIDSPQPVPGVTSHAFLSDELVGVAAPGQLDVRNGRVRPAELTRQTLLVRERGSSTRAVSERYLARVGFRPTKTWELNSNEAIKRAVAEGLGIGFLSRLVVDDEASRHDLVAFRPAGLGPMTRSIQLLHPDNQELTPSERTFVDTLARCCRTKAQAHGLRPSRRS